MKGTYPGIMNLTWGFVDVGDVADAHVRAMNSPNAKGRYLCAAETLGMREVVEHLVALGYTHGKLPKLGMDCAVGDYAARLGSYLQPKGIGSYLRTHIGRVVRFDNSKIKNELGIQFRPVKDSIAETMKDLVRLGQIAG
jgi:dihydroflavonol-4-reductase